MAQDPELHEPTGDDPEIDLSHDLDLVNLDDSQTVDAEIEVDVIRSLLESNGVPVVVLTTPYPPLGYLLQVPRARLEEARQIVAEARSAGPQAAEEAEAESEKDQ